MENQGSGALGVAGLVGSGREGSSRHQVQRPQQRDHRLVAHVRCALKESSRRRGQHRQVAVGQRRQPAVPTRILQLITNHSRGTDDLHSLPLLSACDIRVSHKILTKRTGSQGFKHVQVTF